MLQDELIEAAFEALGRRHVPLVWPDASGQVPLQVALPFALLGVLVGHQAALFGAQKPPMAGGAQVAQALPEAQSALFGQPKGDLEALVLI